MVDELAGSGVPKLWQAYQKEPALTPSSISGYPSPAPADSWRTFAVDKQDSLSSGNRGSIIHHHAVDQNPELRLQSHPSMNDRKQRFSPNLAPNMSHKESSMDLLPRSEPYTPGHPDFHQQALVHTQATLFVAESDMKPTFSSNGSSYSDIGCEPLEGIDDPLAAVTASTSGTCPRLPYPTAKPDMYHASFLSQAEDTSSLSSSFDFIDMPQVEPVLPSYLPLQATGFISNDAAKTSLHPQYNPQTTACAVPPDSKFICSNSSTAWIPGSMTSEAEPWPSIHIPYGMADALNWGNAGYYGEYWPTPESFISTNLVDSQTYDIHNLPSSTLNQPLNVGSPLSPASESIPDYAAGPAPTGPRNEYHASQYVTHPSTDTVNLKKETSLQHENSQPQLQCRPEEKQQSSSPEKVGIKASLHYSDTRNGFLIECKRRGLSYKDIKRIGGFKEAESTLRGRFRTLTKSKEQRVRKPKWQDKDVSYFSCHLLLLVC